MKAEDHSTNPACLFPHETTPDRTGAGPRTRALAPLASGPNDRDDRGCSRAVRCADRPSCPDGCPASDAKRNGTPCVCHGLRNSANGLRAKPAEALSHRHPGKRGLRNGPPRRAPGCGVRDSIACGRIQLQPVRAWDGAVDGGRWTVDGGRWLGPFEENQKHVVWSEEGVIPFRFFTNVRSPASISMRAVASFYRTGFRAVMRLRSRAVSANRTSSNPISINHDLISATE